MNVKNMVADIAKLHRTMAKTSSLSQDNLKAIETLQQLVLMPASQGDEPSVQDGDNQSKNPANAQASLQPMDQFKRIIALISIQ